MPRLFFDHCYTADPDHRFLKQLARLGFALRPSTVEHPGKHFCRFIGFNSPSSPRNFTYLEFIRVGRGGEAVTRPGLSLSAARNLEGFHRRLPRSLRAKFVHKNYDWKKDSRSRLPGWNFVTFRGLGFRTLFPWLTEYEVHPERPPKYPRIRHRNGVTRILALELNVNAPGQSFFNALLGRSLGAGPQKLFFSPGRATALRAVVLEARTLRAFPKSLPREAWRGREAVRIANPGGMWDLLVVARSEKRRRRGTSRVTRRH